jgi:molecular chaperone DnaK
VEDFQAKEGTNLMKDIQALQRLTEAAEKAKMELSNVEKTTINLPFITADKTGPKHIQQDLTREKFEILCKELIDRCRIPVEKALKDAKVDKSGINEVVLVGGSTRIPAIQQLVESLTGKKPNKSVNPDEVVAIGAAIQAGILAGEITDILLLDVTPLSLGVETVGGIMTKLISRNTTIPVKKSELFSTAADNQTNVEIHVLQGEREVVSGNKSLGNFKLEGIPEAPKGRPQIEVTFDINVDGLLSVTAKENESGKEQTVTIQGSSNLSETEIENMLEEAEKYAAIDKEQKEKTDLILTATNYCQTVEEKIEKDELSNCTEDEKKEIQSGISNLRGIMSNKNEPSESIKKSFEELQKLLEGKLN